jgi:hypothetical protein
MRKRQSNIELKKIEFMGIKLSYRTQVIVFITAIIGLITGVVTLAVMCSPPQPPPLGKEHDPAQKDIQLEGERNDPPPEGIASEEPDPPPPPKIENITLTVTTTETASEFAFGGDVKITLEKVIERQDKVWGNITVYSPRESQSFELKKNELQKIGKYEISVEEIGHDYAEFRIVRR